MKDAGTHMYNMSHMLPSKVRKQSMKRSPLGPASQNDLLLGTFFHMVPFSLLHFSYFLPFIFDWQGISSTNVPETLLGKAVANQLVLICWQVFWALIKQTRERLKTLAGEFCSLSMQLS